MKKKSNYNKEIITVWFKHIIYTKKTTISKKNHKNRPFEVLWFKKKNQKNQNLTKPFFSTPDLVQLDYAVIQTLYFHTTLDPGTEQKNVT